jgi:hypothetical protein
MDLEMVEEATIPPSDLTSHSFVTLISGGSKLSYQQFRHALVRDGTHIRKECPDLTPQEGEDKRHPPANQKD